ncbi:uncharacterized protein GIQ15_00532 [Arthroderma uncinatum]|uniref:uncharacterized protein n=1 Tax=Arthroderma uncinatum TaxID=74035 RepID=UPI00144A870F|nr:uncharacterized protein GIQ15_00532 [Arthroderma uncinatum]KAF3491015.1 hypothetical protein GIQ15_00532 [Arthroderma uncinatum]
MDFDHTLDAERNRLMAEWANTFDNSLLDIGVVAARYRKNPRCTLVSKHCGSFNFSLRLHWDDDGPDWLIRFPVLGKAIFAEEKYQNEVAVMRFIRQNTKIPIPEIIAHGAAAENPTGLGPFMIMTWLEGTTMKDLLEVRVPTPDGNSEGVLNPDIANVTLNPLYDGIARILLDLWALNFDKIGSLGYDDVSNSWKVNRRPLTLGMNEFVRLGGIPEDDLKSGTFTSSLDYFFHSSELHKLHLEKQLNSIFDSRDCREKYTCRHLFRSMIPSFVSSKDINGPFKLFCDDFGPGNILVNPSTLEITGVIDWEFCYAAPAQFSASPPSWLLLKRPDHWVQDDGLQHFLKHYTPKFDMLLSSLETHEAERGLSGADEILSIRMRRSMEDRTIWFNLAVRNGWSIDFVYWNLLDNYIYGSASMTERVAGQQAAASYTVTERGSKANIEYQEEEDIEKREYWLPPTALVV